jgi:chromosome segregation ATPase
MFVESIEVEGFKRFSCLTVIALVTGYNVIQGPNGIEKSNLLDAICCGFRCEPQLLRVSNYTDLQSTFGLNVVSTAHVVVTLTSGNKKSFVGVAINEKGTSWSFYNRQQTNKQIR